MSTGTGPGAALSAQPIYKIYQSDAKSNLTESTVTTTHVQPGLSNSGALRPVPPGKGPNPSVAGFSTFVGTVPQFVAVVQQANTSTTGPLFKAGQTPLVGLVSTSTAGAPGSSIVNTFTATVNGGPTIPFNRDGRSGLSNAPELG
jgi:hypothetical protein